MIKGTSVNPISIKKRQTKALPCVKVHIDFNTVMVDALNTPSSPIHESSRQKKSAKK